jgi:hypothetical protein
VARAQRHEPREDAKLLSKTLVPNIALRKAVKEWEHAYALHVRRADIELQGPALAAGLFKTVYRGTLRLHVQGGASRTVTVAVLKMRRGDCATEARTFLMLGQNPKLVRFMGQCIDGEDHILFTEFAPRGSLTDNLEKWEDTITLHHNLFILQQIAESMDGRQRSGSPRLGGAQRARVRLRPTGCQRNVSQNH